MKITKRIREEAIILASAAACQTYEQWCFEAYGNYVGCFETFASELDNWDTATELVFDAFTFACDRCTEETPARECWAEAECMLRTGWTP